MTTDNEVRLLLRFYKDIPVKHEILLEKFKEFKKTKNSDYLIKIADRHVWLHIIGEQKDYYSPHLHLEFESPSENETHIRGLYGPDPVLWTFFMFLHFVIAGVFIIFCGILYSNYVLKNPLTLDIIILTLMVVLWFTLYFIARHIRHKGYKQMEALDKLYQQILES